MIKRLYNLICKIKKALKKDARLKVLAIVAAVLTIICVGVFIILKVQKNNLPTADKKSEIVKENTAADEITDTDTADETVFQTETEFQTEIAETKKSKKKKKKNKKKNKQETTTEAVTTTAAPETTQAVTTTVSVYKETGFRPEYRTEKSPNAGFYEERLSILGDSVAFGFNYYGYIPDERNYAQESVSMWNFDYFTLDTYTGEIPLIDAVNYEKPSLLYMSVGINDLNNESPSEYAELYKNRVKQIMKGSPDTVIIVAGITCVTETCEFTDNETVRKYNNALRKMVYGLKAPNVYFFDAYYALADPETLANDPDNSQDGIHIASYCYETILDALYNFLDDTFAVQQIIRYESSPEYKNNRMLLERIDETAQTQEEVYIEPDYSQYPDFNFNPEEYYYSDFYVQDEYYY